MGFLSAAGLGAGWWRVLDNALVVVVLSVYIVGSAVLGLRALTSRPADRRRSFSYGELALLPQSWRRWLLDEKQSVKR